VAHGVGRALKGHTQRPHTSTHTQPIKKDYTGPPGAHLPSRNGAHDRERRRRTSYSASYLAPVRLLVSCCKKFRLRWGKAGSDAPTARSITRTLQPPRLAGSSAPPGWRAARGAVAGAFVVAGRASILGVLFRCPFPTASDIVSHGGPPGTRAWQRPCARCRRDLPSRSVHTHTPL
jgi:hypothetical protein